MPESPALRRSNKRRVDEPNTYKGFKKAKPSPSILCTGGETPELVEDKSLHGLCWMVSVFNLFTRAPFLRTLLTEDLIELIDNTQKSGVDNRILHQDRNSACPLLPADFVKFCARYDITINLGSWPMTFFWMLVTYSKQQVLTSGGYRITALRMLCLQDITKFGWYCDNTPYPTGFITNKQCTNTMEYKIVGHTESVGKRTELFDWLLEKSIEFGAYAGLFTSKSSGWSMPHAAMYTVCDGEGNKRMCATLSCAISL